MELTRVQTARALTYPPFQHSWPRLPLPLLSLALVDTVSQEFTRFASQLRVAGQIRLTSQAPTFFPRFFFLFSSFFFFFFVLKAVTVISASTMISVRNFTSMELIIFVRVPRDREMSFADRSILNTIIPILPKQTRSFKDP